jgi:hypothetical protein
MLPKKRNAEHLKRKTLFKTDPLYQVIQVMPQPKLLVGGLTSGRTARSRPSVESCDTMQSAAVEPNGKHYEATDTECRSRHSVQTHVIIFVLF